VFIVTRPRHWRLIIYLATLGHDWSEGDHTPLNLRGLGFLQLSHKLALRLFWSNENSTWFLALNELKAAEGGRGAERSLCTRAAVERSATGEGWDYFESARSPLANNLM
jgi:hypothetical protein